MHKDWYWASTVKTNTIYRSHIKPSHCKVIWGVGGTWLLSVYTAVLALIFFIRFAKSIAALSSLLSQSSSSAGGSQGVKTGRVRISLERGRNRCGARGCQFGGRCGDNQMCVGGWGVTLIGSRNVSDLLL